MIKIIKKVKCQSKNECKNMETKCKIERQNLIEKEQKLCFPKGNFNKEIE